MKTRMFTTLALAGLLVAGVFAVALAKEESKPKSDPQLETVIKQNEEILKHQKEILETLEGFRTDLLQLRRRSS